MAKYNEAMIRQIRKKAVKNIERQNVSFKKRRDGSIRVISTVSKNRKIYSKTRVVIVRDIEKDGQIQYRVASIRTIKSNFEIRQNDYHPLIRTIRATCSVKPHKSNDDDTDIFEELGGRGR